MIPEELAKAALKEVKLLKKHATQSELENLDFSRLDAECTYSCIYGQMTGGCFSVRANELVKKCAIAWYFNYETPERMAEGIDDKTPNNTRNFSALETYIYQLGAKNKSIINYLKGRVNSLKL